MCISFVFKKLGQLKYARRNKATRKAEHLYQCLYIQGLVIQKEIPEGR